MYRSLFFLSKLRFYGQLRKLKRMFASPKGAILAVFMLAMLSMMLLPAIMVRISGKGPPPISFDAFLRPTTLFLMWVLTSVGSRFKSAIAFSLPEVEFLFPGPFTRRALLIYKLAIGALGALSFAVMLPLFAGSYLDVWWPAAFVGVWWTMAFLQLATILMTLAVDWFGERFRKLRVAVAVGVAIALAAAMWHAGTFEGDATVLERLSAFESHPVVQTILSPFVIFNRLILATTVVQFALWGSAALALNLLVVACILGMDASFMEASLAASQRRYEWTERVKRGGGVPAIGARTKPRFSLPPFPRVRGAGPIAWRQTLQLWRGSGRLLFVIPILIGPVIGMIAAPRHGAAQAAAAGTTTVLGMTFMIGFFVTTIMPLGMRVDLQHVDVIKSLPIGQTAIVWGSITSAIVYTTFVQLIVIAALAIATSQWSVGAWLALAFAAPVNLLLISSDGVLVILFPSTRKVDPADPLVAMRMGLVYLAKMIYLLLMAAVAAFYMFVAYVFVGQSPWALALSAWVALVIEGAVTVWFAGLLFERYDPSAHAAEEE